MTKKNYSTIEFCISVVMVVFTFFSLFFNIWTANDGIASVGENGFDFLGFSSEFSTISSTTNVKIYSILSGILMWMQIVFVLIYTIFLALLLIKKLSNQPIEDEKQIYVTNFGCVLFSVVYMVIGIVCRKTVINEIIRMNTGSSSVTMSELEKAISTYAYIPLIINLILCGIFIFVCLLEREVNKKNAGVVLQLDEKQTDLADNDEVAQNNDCVTSPVVPASESSKKVENKSKSNQTQSLAEIEKIALLSKYYELIGKGILSQEEFDQKKKDILGL